MMAKDKIRPAAIKVGIPLQPGQRFGFHNFRHSLATFLISKGKDVKTIQGLLRHAKASTTLDLYSQAIDESKLAAQRDIALAITSNQVQVNLRATLGAKGGQNNSPHSGPSVVRRLRALLSALFPRSPSDHNRGSDPAESPKNTSRLSATYLL